MRTFESVVLVAATVTSGLMAGLFFASANNVMPALRGADGRAFVDVMQHINVVILNPLFLGTYMGGLLLSAAAAVTLWSGDDRGSLLWALAGVVLYLAMFVITGGAVNIPLNDQLAAGGDAHVVRERFEATWVTWNLARAVLSAGASGSLTVALLAHG